MKTAKKRRLEGVPAAALPLDGEEIAGAVMGVDVADAKKPLKPHQCRNHLRKTVAAAYRDIVAGFVEEAKKGDCQHLRMATEVVESQKRIRESLRPKSVTAQLLEDLDRQFPD
ncbi:MAG TPA: hypothetical protein VFC39_09840 [Acidobacteriaceae bacterium]|nr:hypothetical protein [Acidobacteriaceae bacterium]